MSVDANVCVELLATTLADKHMANVLPNYLLVMLDLFRSLTSRIEEHIDNK